jgi:hypothetical protein
VTALCSLHPEVAAEGTCARCGRFCCSTCIRTRDPSLCATCTASVTDPFALRNRSLDVVHGARVALQLVRAEWLALLVIALAFAIPGAVIEHAIDPGDDEDVRGAMRSIQFSNTYQGLIAIIASQVMVLLFIARLEGRPLSLGSAFRESFSRWGRGVFTNLRAGLWIVFLLLLFVLPGIWKMTMLMWTSVAAMRVRGDPLECSQELVRGRFAPMLGYGLAAIGPSFAVSAAFGYGLDAVLTVFGGPRLAASLVSAVLDAFLFDGVSNAMMVAGFAMAHVEARRQLEPMDWRFGAPPLNG